MSQNPNLFLSVGKPVKDEYGRIIGKVASFAMTPNGKYDAVFIEFSGGQFSKQPMEQLKFNGSEVTFISTVKAQSSVLCDQIPLIWRKDQALKDLSDKKKISPDIYTEIHNSFDSVMNQLKKDAKILADQISDQLSTCDDEVKAMSYALLNLELEHEIGKVDDEAYRSAFSMLQENLKRTTQERTELELARNKLSNTMLGDAIGPMQKTKTSVELIVEPKQELPEPPVVVYVKEIGKAGI
jgi:PDZ domain-containing secreted protein